MGGKCPVCLKYVKAIPDLSLQCVLKLQESLMHWAWIEGRRLRKGEIYTNIFKGKQPTSYIHTKVNDLKCSKHWLYTVHTVLDPVALIMLRQLKIAATIQILLHTT